MRELLRIHLLALHPIKVYGIALGIVMSLLPFLILAGNASLNPFAAMEALVRVRRVAALALLFLNMVLIWAVWGGALTRMMALDVLGRKESFLRSLVYCVHPSLLVPSSLASLCFCVILLAPFGLWIPALVPFIWLYAGFPYGALTSETRSLGAALRSAHRKMRNWRIGLRLQIKFPAGFVVSTVTVYLACAGLLWLLDPSFSSLRSLPKLSPLLLIPAYGLAYTTSNLKSLQIYLYSKVPKKDDPDAHP